MRGLFWLSPVSGTISAVALAFVKTGKSARPTVMFILVVGTRPAPSGRLPSRYNAGEDRAARMLAAA